MADDPKTPPAAPDPYLERVPDDVLTGLQTLFTLARAATNRFWQPDPRLAPWVTQVENLTGLTETEITRLNALYQDRPAIAREAVLRPANMNRYCALGLALTQSGLRESPVVPGAQLLEDGFILRFADFIFRRLEADDNDQIVDFPLDFELPADPEPAAAPADTPAVADDPTAELFEDVGADDNDDDDDPEELPDGMHVATGDQLRLERLQLESLIHRADATLRDVAQSDIELYLDPAADEADTDTALAEFYHEPCYGIKAPPQLMQLLVMASSITSFWYLDTTIPFARAASRVRWLRRRAAAEALRERLIAHDPETSLTLSLAELLTLYQMMQVLALAGLHDLLPVFEQERQRQRARRQREQPPPEPEPTAATDEEDPDWLVRFFDPSSDEGQYFYHAVSSFTAFTEGYMQGADEQAELAQAKAEIAALAELFDA